MDDATAVEAASTDSDLARSMSNCRGTFVRADSRMYELCHPLSNVVGKQAQEFQMIPRIS